MIHLVIQTIHGQNYTDAAIVLIYTYSCVQIFSSLSFLHLLLFWWMLLTHWSSQTRDINTNTVTVTLRNVLRWWGGSIGRVTDSRFDDPRFEPHQEHKKICEFFQVKNVIHSLSHCQCARPLCYIYSNNIRTHKNDQVCTLKILYSAVTSPCQSLVDFGNIKRPGMHFTDRRINVLL